MDEGVYNEEYVRILGELQKLRQYKSKIKTGNVSIEKYKQRVDEIINVIKEQEGLLTKFNYKIFNALIDRIEILESTHFVFPLRNEMRIKEKIL
jgi:site-specific DNA recombinase